MGLDLLQVAALHSDADTAVALLTLLTDAGLNVDARDPDDSTTALHAAARFDQRAAAAWLLDHGAAIDAEDRLGHTPLMLALMGDAMPAATLLLQRGADTDAVNADGEPVLLGSDLSVAHVKLLVEHGVDLQAVDGLDRNLLHHAALRQDAALIKLALTLGVDPTQCDCHGLTALDVLEIAVFDDDRSPLGAAKSGEFGGAFGVELGGFPSGLYKPSPDGTTLTSPEEDDAAGLTAALHLLRRHQPGPVAHA